MGPLGTLGPRETPSYVAPKDYTEHFRYIRDGSFEGLFHWTIKGYMVHSRESGSIPIGLISAPGSSADSIRQRDLPSSFFSFVLFEKRCGNNDEEGEKQEIED